MKTTAAQAPLMAPEALRDARNRLGLTQGQLARMIGVAGGERISRWERGEDEPRPHLLKRAAEALGLEPLDLLKSPASGGGLRVLRYCAGLTAAELATAASVSIRTYSRWERGEFVHQPAPRDVRALAAGLGVDRTEVLHALDADDSRHSRRTSQGAGARCHAVLPTTTGSPQRVKSVLGCQEQQKDHSGGQF